MKTNVIEISSDNVSSSRLVFLILNVSFFLYRWFSYSFALIRPLRQKRYYNIREKNLYSW